MKVSTSLNTGVWSANEND